MSAAPIKVFISYAWEPDPQKDMVWELARWLETNSNGKIKVLIDRLFENRPPEEGWPVWMQRAVENSDIVLIVCSPLYKTRFEKNDPVGGGGAGVNFEGAHITQYLYNAKLRNNKFYPILPDGGDRANIPTILQAFDNSHNFPSGNDRILKLIYGDNPTLVNEIAEAMATVSAEAKSGELEKKIVEEIIEVLEKDNVKDEKKMLTPIQIIVRSFLLLNDPLKITIAKNLNIFDPSYNAMRPVDRDKAIFKQVKEKKLLHDLWEQVNAINPFENATNPF